MDALEVPWLPAQPVELPHQHPSDAPRYEVLEQPLERRPDDPPLIGETSTSS